MQSQCHVSPHIWNIQNLLKHSDLRQGWSSAKWRMRGVTCQGSLNGALWGTERPFGRLSPCRAHRHEDQIIFVHLLSRYLLRAQHDTRTLGPTVREKDRNQRVGQHHHHQHKEAPHVHKEQARGNHKRILEERTTQLPPKDQEKLFSRSSMCQGNRSLSLPALQAAWCLLCGFFSA